MKRTLLLLSILFLYAISALRVIGSQPSTSVASAGITQNEILPSDARLKIDKAAQEIISKTGAPSVSLAVVKDGKLAYVHAYGIANMETHKPATTAMRYSIGSVSKQFTAAAILLLTQEGKLSLDDKVEKWLPGITRAGDVRVRQLLSMTSGYQDFWPQDYVMPGMLLATSAPEIIKDWARKPLDFEPGTKWQYSNTNYVIAGLIAESSAGMSLSDYLQQRIFGPLKMNSVFDTDAAPLGMEDPMRYQRFGLGPARPAPKEGRGWLFAAGELAMTAEDLAKWDISFMDQRILDPASYQEMEKEVQLRNGVGSRYGLGVGVSLVNGRRLISHNGEVSGFTALNTVYPDDRIAIIVLANMDATNAPRDLGNKIAEVLFNPTGGESSLATVKNIFAGLQRGKLDQTLFTANANAYFSDQALKDFAASLAPLGKPTDFSEMTVGLRGGMTFHRYSAQFAKKKLVITIYVMPDGKLEQYIVGAD